MRLHLTQIHYSPAYYDAPIDYLAEPSDGKFLVPELGRLRALDEVSGLLLELKGLATSHISAKLNEIACWSANRKADLLVFPEYAVPVQALCKLRNLAMDGHLTIVAGSHRVSAGNESRSTYESLGISSLATLGTSICPILLPTGDVNVVAKASRSKWEPSLQLGSPTHAIVDVPCNGGTVRVGVLLCIDALSPQILGNLWASSDHRPSLVVCPSLSPSIDPFASAAELVSLNEAAFAYANSASFGGTVFYVPDQWKSAVEMSTGTFAPLPAAIEGLIEVDFHADQLFLKRGSAITEVLGRRPVSVPVVYQSGLRSLSQLQVLAGFVKEALSAGDVATAVDCLDTYLAEPEKNLPELVLKNLQQLRHAVLPLYSGKLDLVDEAFQFLAIPDSCRPTLLLWANQTKKALDTLLAIMGRDDITDPPEAIWDSVKQLKKLQKALPLPDTADAEQGTTVAAVPEAGFKGSVNLVEAFQNRGTDFDRVRDFTQNADSRVLFVTGGRGIGKTDFLNAVFLKNLRDWHVIRIPVARGSRVARIIADIAFQLGITLDIDSLAAATYHVFQQKVRKVFSSFFTQPRRALIIDDLSDLLENATGRDFRHFETLLQEARSPQQFGGGRVILVSSTWIKGQWVNAKGVSHIPLRELQDIYIRRIVEYQLRLKGAVSGEAPPSIPQQLLDLIRGHALSARLLVDAAGDRALTDLASDLEGITEHIAGELLKHVKLEPDQRTALTSLSIYRLPVRADLLSYEDLGLKREALAELARGAVLNYDGALFGMHEAVRRFFYGRLNGETKKHLHRLAVSYYESERSDLDRRGVAKNPSTAAELVYHAVMCGDAAVAARLRTLVVEELKPAARQIYREDRDYQRALQLYKVIADIVPDDAEVVAYLGRCHARLRSWDESDLCFDRAVKIARRRGEEWWVLRDWGHIRARYGFYDQARECFERSEQKRGAQEPSISAALAYMYWRQGDVQAARELFEEALELNPNHNYALTYYAKLLVEVGEYSRARGLRERLDALQGSTPLIENDIEVEIEDL